MARYPPEQLCGPLEVSRPQVNGLRHSVLLIKSLEVRGEKLMVLCRPPKCYKWKSGPEGTEVGQACLW